MELEKRLDELAASRAETTAATTESDRLSQLVAQMEQTAKSSERSMAEAYSNERQRLQREHDAVCVCACCVCHICVWNLVCFYSLKIRER